MIIKGLVFLTIEVSALGVRNIFGFLIRINAIFLLERCLIRHIVKCISA